MASPRILTALLISCCCCWGVLSASKILLIAPLATKSHMQFFGEIAKVLAGNGHQVREGDDDYVKDVGYYMMKIC